MIILKEFSKKNITQNYISWLNNKNLMKYSRHKKTTFDYEICKNFYKKMKVKKNLFFAIYLNKLHIGNIVAYLDLVKKKAEISILTTRANTGFAACKKIITILKKLKINKIYCGTNKKNIKMKRLCKKLNMKTYKKNKNSIFFYRNI
jgi:hypothetical protein